MDRIEALLAQADQAQREGRGAEAAASYEAVVRLDPGQPRALNALGNLRLSGGDPAAAAELFRRATASDPRAAPIWLNLSYCLRAMGDDAGELAALEGALVADPYFMVALLHKAQWFERKGQGDAAVRCYRALIGAAPSLDSLPPAMRAALEHGQAIVAEADAHVDRKIREAIGDRPIRSERFAHCLDVLAGRRKIYVHEPLGLHFPYLPAIQFFDRTLFPWFADLEAATDTIRAEFLQLVSDEIPVVPYVNIAGGEPVNQWEQLNNSLDWGAQFLWKNGVPVEAMIARCPGTAAAMRRLPLLDIAGQGPTVMFSILRPHTRIPPHTGVTNTRSVVHLPLVVPAGCSFRVGSETRAWQVGEAWAFDDTIEHEARNDSDEVRIILIIDAWNPYLDPEERDLLRITAQVLQTPDTAV